MDELLGSGGSHRRRNDGAGPRACARSATRGLVVGRRPRSRGTSPRGPGRRGRFEAIASYSAEMSLRIEGIEAWRWESRYCASPVLRLRAIP